MPGSRATPFSGDDRTRIGVGVHYLALPEHPYYQRAFGWRPDDYPARRCASAPDRQPAAFRPKLTDDDVDRVIEAVLSTIE